MSRAHVPPFGQGSSSFGFEPEHKMICARSSSIEKTRAASYCRS